MQLPLLSQPGVGTRRTSPGGAAGLRPAPRGGKGASWRGCPAFPAATALLRPESPFRLPSKGGSGRAARRALSAGSEEPLGRGSLCSGAGPHASCGSAAVRRCLLGGQAEHWRSVRPPRRFISVASPAQVVAVDFRWCCSALPCWERCRLAAKQPFRQAPRPGAVRWRLTARQGAATEGLEQHPSRLNYPPSLVSVGK